MSEEQESCGGQSVSSKTGTRLNNTKENKPRALRAVWARQCWDTFGNSLGNGGGPPRKDRGQELSDIMGILEELTQTFCALRPVKNAWEVGEG